VEFEENKKRQKTQNKKLTKIQINPYITQFRNNPNVVKLILNIEDLELFLHQALRFC
jgi:hypothetical protein